MSTDTETQLAAEVEVDPAFAWLSEHAPAAHEKLQRELLAQLRSRFGLVGTPPATGTRPYLNFYPAPRFGSSRVGALTLTTGRFYATLNPNLVHDFPGAEAAESKYLATYLRTAADIELALSLVEGALRERGWEPEQ